MQGRQNISGCGAKKNNLFPVGNVTVAIYGMHRLLTRSLLCLSVFQIFLLLWKLFDSHKCWYDCAFSSSLVQLICQEKFKMFQTNPPPPPKKHAASSRFVGATLQVQGIKTFGDAGAPKCYSITKLSFFQLKRVVKEQRCIGWGNDMQKTILAIAFLSRGWREKTSGAFSDFRENTKVDSE